MAKSTVYRQRRRDKSGEVRLASEIVRRTPTQAEVQELFHYDPYTGVITHKKTRGKGRAGHVAGRLDAYGYIGLRVMNRYLKGHQIAWLYMSGDLPSTIDHINGNRSDNRWSNLRAATSREQTWNSPAHTRCVSGMKGAWPCKTTGRWQSILTDGKTRIWLGRFDTAKEAHSAWMRKAIELRGAEWVARATSKHRGA